jgi:hypothetical protein
MNLVDTIKRYKAANIPCMIFGAPGVGKSQQVHQAAEGKKVIDIRLSMLDPVDLRGLPLVDRSDKGPNVEWARPEFIPQDGEGILFFDELNTAPVSVMNAALQIILDRKCGPHKLGDGWYICAAGNKTAHRAHVQPLSAPLRNRFAIVNYEPDVKSWTTWAFGSGIHDDVVGFLNFRPALLSTDSKDEYENFASPRSWERVSTLIASGTDDMDFVAGLIGKGAAAEFDGYRRELKDMPDIDALLTGRERFTHNPKRMSVSYAVAMGLSSRLLRGDAKFIAANADKACEIAGVMPPEITCLFIVRSMVGNNDVRKAILSAKAAHKWVTQHSELIDRYGIRK